MKIYTKTGDKGTTALLGGQRVAKSDHRLEVYGTIDELNSYLGLILSELPPELLEELKSPLITLQQQLFLLGSHIACASDKDRKKYQLPDFTSEPISQLEVLIDEMQNQVPELKNFILPGGHKAAAQSHIARTVCRRAERQLSALEGFPAQWLGFLNRLSDYLFTLARFINARLKVIENLWMLEK